MYFHPANRQNVTDQTVFAISQTPICFREGAYLESVSAGTRETVSFPMDANKFAATKQNGTGYVKFESSAAGRFCLWLNSAIY